MKCKSCGKDITEGAKFCSNCGVTLGKSIEEEIRVSSDELVGEVKRLLHEGNVTKLVVKDDKGKVMLEIPAWVGIVGAILAPWLAALGAIAALATDCTITVIRREDTK
jgi:hypothetical protein